MNEELWHTEWERRKLRNAVHLTIGGCLGACALSNVVEVIFLGHTVFFHSVNDDTLVTAIYDYLDQMVAAEAFLPPPPLLAPLQFTAVEWEGRPDGAQVEPPRRRGAGPGSIIFLTHAATDLLALEKARASLPADFPPLVAANLLDLPTDAAVDAFLDRHLPDAEIAVVRVHGGRDSFGHGFDRLQRTARERGLWLCALSGTDALDPELTAISSVAAPLLHEVYAYLHFGGPGNLVAALRMLADHLLTTGFDYDPPVQHPQHGLYHPAVPEGTLDGWRARHDLTRPAIGLLFYRAHFVSGNTDFVDAVVTAADEAGLNVLPVFTYSLRDGAALAYFQGTEGVAIDALVSTLSFSVSGVNADGPTETGAGVALFQALDVPVYQAITAGISRDRWQQSDRGLPPVEAAMQVVLPEFDGRISTVPISFRNAEFAGRSEGAATRALTPANSRPQPHGEPLPLLADAAPADTSALRVANGALYAPDRERIAQLIRTVAAGIRLRRTANGEKRVAVVLTNSTARISRIGNAVGLDAPASLLALLRAMQTAGYDVGELPVDSDTLIHDLIGRSSYDLTQITPEHLARAVGQVSEQRYAAWFKQLPEAVQAAISTQWGPPPGEAYVHNGHLALAGIELGKVVIVLQPPRGYGMDPNLIYHKPDLPPPHYYVALYRWLREQWRADAIIHMGKHGTLEWLPGKATAPSALCFPDQLLGGLPFIYPFIINDPGEGAQAKRRAHAVIVDHMTPPMTAAGSYGDLAELAQLVDEYYQTELLDPAKLPVLQRQIWDLVVRAKLDSDMAAVLNRNVNPEHQHAWDPTLTDEGAPASMEQMAGKDMAHLIQEIDGYLCELAGMQIRDGLHILGFVPEDEQLDHLLAQLLRLPNPGCPSLHETVARGVGSALRIDAAAEKRYPGPIMEPADEPSRSPVIAPHSSLAAQSEVEDITLALIAGVRQSGFDGTAVDDVVDRLSEHLPELGLVRSDLCAVLRYVCNTLMPKLRQTEGEIGMLLHALSGGYVPAGPSGAPTRGMAHVLPTGRNFYALDPRTIPSEAAWRVGRDLAGALLDRYQRDEGTYPERVGLSIWGTSAMRTHGDDIAQVFALLGVRPRRQAESHRLEGVEIIPLAELGRPRIDVVCRISGFFRDAFPSVVSAIDDAVLAVAALDEPPDQNFVRKHVLGEQQRLQRQGVAATEAARRASYRVFGCAPGTYGAGILPLLDERNWTDSADFAQAYVNWGGFAYTGDTYGIDARRDFETQLGGVQVAAKNQDNREHDIFDSDDYLQYHGGMIATIRALTGKNPRRYFGDSSDPANAKVRDLKEEALRVFRARVVNPKWLAGIQRHGYKGGLELAATVDYLFGYDATADVLDDWVYARLTEAYLENPDVVEFLKKSNPWALEDIASKLQEAIDRGLWMDPSEEHLWVIRGFRGQ